MTAPVMLLIRDGWGINPGGRAAAEANGDVTLLARTSFQMSSTANTRARA